jgi:hypothetical protein
MMGRSKFEIRSSKRRSAYVMLETVIATGLLIVGLGVIGAQLQDSNAAVHKMRLKTQAILLAETQLAMMDLGLVELDSVDELQEGDFGSRYPDWGWRIITEPTAIDGLFRVTVEVMYLPAQEEYREDSFDHDASELMFSASAFRQPPKTLDLVTDFGMSEEELTDFIEKVGEAGIPCFDGATFDQTCLAGIDIEDLFKALPALQELGINLGDLESIIPPDLLSNLQESGFMDELEGAGDQQGGQNPQTNPEP